MKPFPEKKQSHSQIFTRLTQRQACAMRVFGKGKTDSHAIIAPDSWGIARLVVFRYSRGIMPLMLNGASQSRRVTISTLNQQPSANEIRDLVLQSLDDDKGLDITQIPLAGKSSIADYLIIASGSSGRQISAMCDHVEEKLKKAGASIYGREGKSQGDWIVIDALDVVVHLFRPEVRDFYQLEKMWSKDAADEVVMVGADG